MLSVPGLVDAYSEASDLPKDCIATCESLRNSYTPSSYVKKNNPGKRIDYIMFHPGSKMQIDLKNYCLPLAERVPNHSFSYSDHEAISATLVINKKKVSDISRDLQDKRNVLESSVDVLNAALRRLVGHKIVYLIFGILLFVLLLISFAFNSPFGYPIIFGILRVIVTCLIIFCILMGIIWNKIERHGVLAGKYSIEVSLRQFDQEL